MLQQLSTSIPFETYPLSSQYTLHFKLFSRKSMASTCCVIDLQNPSVKDSSLSLVHYYVHTYKPL